MKEKREQGLCECNTPLTPGRHTCDACTRKSGVSGKKRKRRLLRKGLCIKCGRRSHGEGVQQCRFCLDRFNRKQSAVGPHIRINRKAAGVCSSCGDKIDTSGYLQCSDCRRMTRLSVKKINRARRARGLCTSCGGRKPDKSHVVCAPCRKEMRVYGIEHPHSERKSS